MPHDIPQRPPLQTRLGEAPHPSGPGRGDGYSQDMRGFVMELQSAGESSNPIFEQLRALASKFPSKRSGFRWKAQEKTLGHTLPCRRTGNKRAEVFHDHNLLLLALYRITYPKSTAAEVNAFLYKANYGSLDFRFYSASQITIAEQRIGLTRKRGSTTAYQAYLPINKQKRWMFWNLPFPYGIADIPREELIDLDECGIELSSADRKIGKAYVGKRCQQSGLYSKTDKLNLLLAISGDHENPMRWRDIWTGEGTTGNRMADFIRKIIKDLAALDTPSCRFCFIMDNLRSHHNQQMAAIIIGAGHRLVFRAPYYPVDGPIEYVFNTIQGILRIRNDRITDGPTLQHEIDVAIASIPSFAPYFINCGFWRTNK